MAKSLKNKTGNNIGVTPLGDRVLIEIPKREETTASGIIIPDTVDDGQTDTKRGRVLAVGDGKYDDGALVPMHVSVGDEVLFEWGNKVEVDKVEYHLVSESNILAILK